MKANNVLTIHVNAHMVSFNFAILLFPLTLRGYHVGSHSFSLFVNRPCVVTQHNEYFLAGIRLGEVSIDFGLPKGMYGMNISYSI